MGPRQIDHRALISRRGMLLGAVGMAGTAALAACSGDGGSDDSSAGAENGAGGSGGGLLLAPLFPRQGLAVTGVEQRLPFTVLDAQGVPPESAPGSIDLEVAAEAGPLDTVTVEGFGEGLATTYYPLNYTFPDTGLYTVKPTIQGEALDELAFEVAAPGDVPIPGPGDPMIPVDTPTYDLAHGVDPICTRDPVCDLHEVTLTDGLDEGRPMAFLIATPAFCQTAVCGPVLDILLDQVGAHPDVRFIHAEVYANPEAVDNIAQATVADAPTAYSLPFEPALFLADAGGTIVDRLDTIFDDREVGEALTSLEEASGAP